MSKVSRAFESDLQRLLEDPQHRGHPLQSALAEVWGRYQKLLERLDRIVDISDGYQGCLLARESRLDAQLDKQLRQLQKLARISDRYQSMLRELNQALLQASTHDVLTGLFNRRMLIDRLKEESARCQRTQLPFSVAMLDIDDFKSVNDKLGHDAGDKVLSKVAQCLPLQLRESDVCGRWGGEEFLLIFPNTTLAEAMVVLERVRSAIATLQIVCSPRCLSVTVSAGLAVQRLHDDCYDTVNRADGALLRAKRQGRNCCEVEA
jgi:diguanylate cyclase (GGDEF)-like protein